MVLDSSQRGQAAGFSAAVAATVRMNSNRHTATQCQQRFPTLDVKLIATARIARCEYFITNTFEIPEIDPGTPWVYERKIL
jgi:hypothetical protein